MSLPPHSHLTASVQPGQLADRARSALPYAVQPAPEGQVAGTRQRPRRRGQEGGGGFVKRRSCGVDQGDGLERGEGAHSPVQRRWHRGSVVSGTVVTACSTLRLARMGGSRVRRAPMQSPVQKGCHRGSVRRWYLEAGQDGRLKGNEGAQAEPCSSVERPGQ